MVATRPQARRGRAAWLTGVLCIVLIPSLCRADEPAAPATRPAVAPIKEPYQDPYKVDRPHFLDVIERARTYGGDYRGWSRSAKEMKLSSEPSFFTLNVIDEDSRAYALVEAALKKEAQGEFREALKIHQQVIEKYPQTLYRISRYGIFVPVSQYCQRRILGFPAADLAHYRTQYDARAAEAFEQARRRYSLLGLSDIVDTMLATSYGGKAVLELGNAALDTGHYLAALEYYTTVRDFFPDRALRTPELALKIAFCRKMLGNGSAGAVPVDGADSGLSQADLGKVREAVRSVAYVKPPFHSQLASAPHIATDDYTLMPPTTDPLGLQRPVWQRTLPGSRRDFFIYTQPVVTNNSVIYRHKNILYCRSILNGEPRWINDLGGRAVWQNPDERQYPQEDILVQDGLVFATISKAGPSLAAFDEVTGQLKWAYGPMVASTVEESRMRFEAAPTGGPRTVYAGYVLDNIEGETHTDSEYGVIAFESTTGRVQWQRRLCRLSPGKFTAGFAEKRRNRIRSFTSPPLYHQGTVYYNTNAGATAAIDAMSGRVKWLMRYPYHPSVHDATRTFGRIPFWSGLVNTGGMHEPSFWLNQRPLLVGEQLFVLPVDSSFMLCIDRRTGRVNWTRSKGGTNYTYLAGPSREGHLVLTTSGRVGTVHLIDPQDGETVWSTPDLIIPDTHPVMKYGYLHLGYTFMGATDPRGYAGMQFYLASRPFLTTDDRIITSYLVDYGPYVAKGWHRSFAEVSLKDRKILSQRRYYGAAFLTYAGQCITNAKGVLKDMAGWLPATNDQDRTFRRQVKEVAGDTVPENTLGPFMPCSRVTFSRYGVPFELRFEARRVAMVYDRAAVSRAIASRSDPASDFARAELGIADSRLDEAAALLKKCLATISSEDLDFRAAIHQQLFRVHKRLARRAIRAKRPDANLAHCLGMSRTANTLAEEIETLFAVSEAYQRKGETAAAGRALRTIISTYGHHEYPIAPVAFADSATVLAAAHGVLDQYKEYVAGSLYGNEFTRSIELMRKGLPLYFSTVSPLPKTLTVRAGELAAMRLMRLQAADAQFAAAFRATAGSELAGKSAAEQIQRLWEFPTTAAAQQVLEALFAQAAKGDGESARQQLWRLADAARVSGLKVPAEYLSRVGPPAARAPDAPIRLPRTARKHDFKDEEAAARLVLERRGDRSIRPHLLFLGTRVRKRLDNKFVVTAMELTDGRIAWETPQFRLKGMGAEPGFFEAFVHGDLVVVHGLYDVLAFRLTDGGLAWKYRVPFDFEIRSALLAGDLLILSGATETLALYVGTDSKVGEVAWQVKEMGDLYIDPYMRGDRLISVRKLPYSVTARYRLTGRLIGRLDLPDLSRFREHPLIDGGPKAVPAAHREAALVLSDGWYYILIDVDRLAVRWKRLIDANDITRQPPLRFAVSAKYLAVLKEDYDQDAIYMFSAETGRLLWRSDPKDGSSPRPMHSILISGEQVYGIQPHAGQGFYLVGRDCRGGRLRFSEEVVGYQERPAVTLLTRRFGKHVVVRVTDRQDFELRVFDAATGKGASTLKMKGVPPFGMHGRMSATVQAGRLILLSKDKLAH